MIIHRNVSNKSVQFLSNELNQIEQLKKKLTFMQSDPDVKALLKEPEDFEWFLNVNRVNVRINKMKSDLAEAIDLLNISRQEDYEPTSFLDFGILLSLYYLQLHIY